MDQETQEFIAIALVLVVAGTALLRQLTKPKSNSCDSCKSNPNEQNKANKSESENLIRFIRTPGKPK
jgi:hypothetical protein